MRKSVVKKSDLRVTLCSDVVYIPINHQAKITMMLQ